MKKIKDLSLKSKFFATTFIAVILVGLASLFALEGVMAKNQELLYRSIANSLVYSAERIHSSLKSIEFTSSIIIADSGVQNNLTALAANHNAKSFEHNIARRSLYNLLHSYYFNTNTKYVDYMSFYYNDIPIPTNSDHQLVPRNDSYNEVKEAAIAEKGGVKWLSSYGNQKGLLLARAIRKIKYTHLDHLGLLLIKVNLNEIIGDATDFGEQFSDASFILLDGPDVLYQSASLSESQAETLIDFNRNYSVISLDDDQYFAVKDSIPGYGLDYICLVSYTDTQKHISKTYFIYFAIVAASILLALTLSSTLVNNITKHLKILTEKMRRFQNADMAILPDTYDYSNRKDELGILHTNFDRMASEIKTLVHKNYTSEILRKDAQLKALEAQIDPHFLYNTLDSINWRAKSVGEDQISLMVESLGNLLRSNLSQTSDLYTLREELELINNYITIQQIRYDDRLIYQSYLSDPKLLEASFLKLCIQPLVENAIHYALEEITEECYISIHVTLSGDDLEVRVKNNGSQFQDDLLNRLKTKDIIPCGCGIALTNIDHRIKLKFGDAYGLSFYNEDEFAIVMITIPYISTI